MAGAGSLRPPEGPFEKAVGADPGEPALGVIQKGVHDLLSVKISSIETALVLFKFAVIGAYLAMIGDTAPEKGPPNPAGLSTLPDVLEALFRQIADLSSRPDDETAEIAVSVDLDEKVLPGFAAGRFRGFHA
jgi:hypothetical protein